MIGRMIKIGEKGAGANGAKSATILIVINPMDIRLGVQDMIDTS